MNDPQKYYEGYSIWWLIMGAGVVVCSAVGAVLILGYSIFWLIAKL